MHYLGNLHFMSLPREVDVLLKSPKSREAASGRVTYGKGIVEATNVATQMVTLSPTSRYLPVLLWAYRRDRSRTEWVTNSVPAWHLVQMC